MHSALKSIAFAIICLLGVSAHALSELHIKAGETFYVGPKLAKLDLESFKIESKAVIEIDPAIGMWVVSAKSASIGDAVVIRGGGTPGKNGVSGQSHKEAKRCDLGKHGTDGRAGGNGSNGVSIVWSLGVSKFGNVIVNLSGGKGGDGGNGGDGQNIPHIEGCSAPAGDAGDGGNGGDGGSGGSFTFHYWLLDEAADVSGNSIAVRFAGGRAGKSGSPGFPGVGSPGKTIAGKWVAGGADGAEGRSGTAGLMGRTGALEIRKVADESGSDIVVEAPELEVVDPSTDERLKALEITVQKLEARIKLLELDKQ